MRTSRVWQFVEWRLRRTVPAAKLPSVVGDLAEDYVRRRADVGALRAGLWLFREVWSLGRAYRADALTGWIRRGWVTDGREALRALRKTRVQTATIVACLSAGSVLTVVVFGVLNAMVAGELPGVRDRGQLTRVQVERRDHHRIDRLSIADFREMPAAVPGLAAWGAEMRAGRLAVRVDGQENHADAALVSGGYFATVGTTPAAGRLLGPADDRVDAPPTIVISHELWLRRFGADPRVVGTTVQVTSRLGSSQPGGPPIVSTATFQVVGVTPPGFAGIQIGDWDDVNEGRQRIWLPLSQAGAVGRDHYFSSGGAVGPAIIARLSQRTTRREAEALLQTLVSRIRAEGGGGEGRSVMFRLTPFHLIPFDTDEWIARALIATILTTVPLVILGIACTNVAGVQLARAIGRRHELAVRMSLGASRSRVVRLLAIETAWLAATAAVVGWFAGREGLRLSANVLPIAPIADDRVLLVAIALPLAVTFVAGIVPAWRATGFDVLSGLRSGARGGSAASPRVRRIIIGAQVTLSIVLLHTAGTLVRGLAVPPAGARDDVVVARVGVADLGLGDARERGVREEIVARLHAMPSVEAVGLSVNSLFRSPTDGLCWAGSGQAPSPFAMHGSRMVSPGLFDALDLRMRHGRGFRPDDGASQVIVNEAFARSISGSASVLGQLITVSRGSDSPPVAATVIGVVEDHERTASGRPHTRCYTPWDHARAGSFTLHARTTLTAEVTSAIRGWLADIDSTQRTGQVGVLADVMQAQHREEFRMLHDISRWFGLGGTLALGLTAIGLFGVLSYGAAQRTREFGVRLALGARPADIARSLLRESIVVVTIGTAAGTMLATPAAWLITQGLAGARVVDPVLGAVTLASLLTVGLLVAARPVRNAMRLDPVAALRVE